MGNVSAEKIRTITREKYGSIAGSSTLNESCSKNSACCGQGAKAPKDLGRALGYSQEEIDGAPSGANMGLGCGNPKAIAALKPGEIVLDLGCGGGFDCFLAAKEVGAGGRVIGVDMTPEMLSKARENARVTGANNVEFRLGEIEHLPIEDGSIDVILSNCVINLSPEKAKVYREAFRVLKPGGRLAISDVVAIAPLADEMKQDLALLVGCVAGAETVPTIQGMLEEARFQQIQITPLEESKRVIREWFPGHGFENTVASATIEAIKPVNACSATAVAKPRKPAVDSNEIRKNVYALFQSGYLCAEVVSAAVLDVFSDEPYDRTIRCASGFCGGVGGTSQELCGAFTGGVIALSHLLGRDKPGDSLVECGALIEAFRSQFLAEVGSLNCSTILAGYQDQKNPHLGCVQLTAQAAQMLVDLVVNAEKDWNLDMGAFLSMPRDQVELGHCPFS